MVKVKRIDGLPPNFDDLPAKLQQEIEESLYRRQLKWSHGYRPGDPCLRSMSGDGVPVSGSFGRCVDESSDDSE